ncbi:MAG: orotidine-5'-phosphate decarboxylase [Oscillospiraceae bacterium]|nr:orotidine-5'-phosphate decarboxylase [Oscillospiraceae bacterium]
MSLDLLIEKIVKTQNPTVVGLDPKLEYVPEFIKKKAFVKYGMNPKGAAKAILKFNKGIIDAIYDIVPAVKPQLAFYEMLGVEGVKAFHKTIVYAKERGLYVIADGKRNDIGSTAEGYAAAYLGKIKIGEELYSPFPVDALTVNGYLGSDGIMPFTDACKKYDKGIFVLVKTSNPSSGELQDKVVGKVTGFADGDTIYEIMGRMCEKWGAAGKKRYGYSGVGAVVGATYPEQIKELREMLPYTFFLIPGYGAQGGRAEDLKSAFDKNGLGGIVNSSRAIMCAYQKEKCNQKDFAEAARREALKMKEALMEHIGIIKLP